MSTTDVGDCLLPTVDTMAKYPTFSTHTQIETDSGLFFRRKVPKESSLEKNFIRLHHRFGNELNSSRLCGIQTVIHSFPQRWIDIYDKIFLMRPTFN